ncbi:MAG TPA: hypothetical protein VFT72_11980 [Opitutaceae bacterium]|nr:hypothetical protein [Opitutaceae bacterium]
MAFFLAGFGLLLHVLFWGVGLSLLITPRRWRLGWPALCAPAGLALQSAVVWFGARTNVEGAEVYAVWCEVIPVALLGLALYLRRENPPRRLFRELKAWQGVGLLMVVALNVLLIPFAVSSKILTSSSLGSCDAADYAAGARVFLEFSRLDRSGFMGLTEVVRLHSVDNFFDHWVRLNHFTPSALLAFHSAIFDYRPYELVSVATAVFVALSLPTVFWFARSTFRFGSAASGMIAALYGFSPLLWYAVYNAAMSQLLAALAVALLNGLAIVAWRERARGWQLLKWSGLFAVAYWLIMGAYNFIVVVCLVPAFAFVALEVLQTRMREMRYLGVWLASVLLPLVAVGLIFTQRTLGLIERFVLFQEYDFGWKIPALTPEAWLGFVGSASLHALPDILRWPVLGLIVLLSIIAYFAAFRGEKEKKLLLACASLPICAGYLFLYVRGELRGTNASYDAYKLLCVFLPGILAASMYWLTLFRLRAPAVRAIAAIFAIMILAFNAYSARLFVRRMEIPPLLVGRALADLRQLEREPEVTSLNLLIDDFWSRLWANAMLLHKAQYFPSFTYEGRRNTALKGQWDLCGGIIHYRNNEVVTDFPVARPYSLLDTRAKNYLRIHEDAGWYDPEVLTRSGRRWRWTRGDAKIRFENPREAAQPLLLKLSVRALLPRDLQIWYNGSKVETFAVDADLRTVKLPKIMIAPGQTMLELRSSQPPVSPGPGDERKLGFAVYDIEIEFANGSSSSAGATAKL